MTQRFILLCCDIRECGSTDLRLVEIVEIGSTDHAVQYGHTSEYTSTGEK